MPGLVLSLFPGAGLMDEGFHQAGFCVVRGPDAMLGQDIRRFTLRQLEQSHFEGIIAGPPCQDFSRARRRPPSGHGLEMLHQLCRLITEARPEWWLVENVPGVPTIEIEGYTTQRFNMFASDFGMDHRRNRSFQFGSKGEKLVIPRGSQSHLKLKPTPLASDYSRSRKRNFADLCERMGLPRAFTLPGLSRRAQFRAVGQGVPVVVARAVAQAICDRRVTVTAASVFVPAIVGARSQENRRVQPSPVESVCNENESIESPPNWRTNFLPAQSQPRNGHAAASHIGESQKRIARVRGGGCEAAVTRAAIPNTKSKSD